MDLSILALFAAVLAVVFVWMIHQSSLGRYLRFGRKAKARRLYGVIDQILMKIPNDQQWDSLRRRLLDKQESVLYTAPEGMVLRWQEVGIILYEELGEPAGVPWKKEIVAIIRGGW